MGNFCCSRVVPKYSQHLAACFPSKIDEKSLPPSPTDESGLFLDPLAAPRFLSDLLYYCDLVPQRLPELTESLANQIRADLKRNAYRRVRTGVLIFLGLLESAHSETSLPLYFDRCLSVCLELFHSRRPHQILFAAQLSAELASFIDDAQQFRQFMTLLPLLCGSPVDCGDEFVRWRYYSLRCLSALASKLETAAEPQPIKQLVQAALDMLLKPECGTEKFLGNTGIPNRSLSFMNAPAISNAAVSNETAADAAIQIISTLSASVYFSESLSAILSGFAAVGWSDPTRFGLILSCAASSAGAADFIALKLLEKSSQIKLLGNNNRAETAEEKEKETKSDEAKALVEVELTAINSADPTTLKLRILDCVVHFTKSIRSSLFNSSGLVDFICNEISSAFSQLNSDSADRIAVCCSKLARQIASKSSDQMGTIANIVKHANHSKSESDSVRIAIFNTIRSAASHFNAESSGALESSLLTLTRIALAESSVEVRSSIYRSIIEILLPCNFNAAESADDEFDTNFMQFAASQTKNFRNFEFSHQLQSMLHSLIYHEIFTETGSNSPFPSSSPSLHCLAWRLLLTLSVRDGLKSHLNFTYSLMEKFNSTTENSNSLGIFLISQIEFASKFFQFDEENNGFRIVSNSITELISSGKLNVKYGKFEFNQKIGMKIASEPSEENFPSAIMKQIKAEAKISEMKLNEFEPISAENLKNRPSISFRPSENPPASPARNLTAADNEQFIAEDEEIAPREESPVKPASSETQIPSSEAELEEFLQSLGGASEVRKPRSDASNTSAASSASAAGSIGMSFTEKSDAVDEKYEFADSNRSAAPICSNASNLLEFQYPRVSSFDFYLGAEMES